MEEINVADSDVFVYMTGHGGTDVDRDGDFVSHTVPGEPLLSIDLVFQFVCDVLMTICFHSLACPHACVGAQ